MKKEKKQVTEIVKFVEKDFLIGDNNSLIPSTELASLKEFKKYLESTRSMAIDMETATIFVAGFYNKIPTGALLLVSDQPMISTGVKTADSDKKVTESYVNNHLVIGIDSLNELKNNGLTVKHLRF